MKMAILCKLFGCWRGWFKGYDNYCKICESPIQDLLEGVRN